MRLLTTLIMFLALTGCGSDPNAAELSPESVETMNDIAKWGENLPDCSDVWIAGKTLPKEYDGCREGDTIIAGVSVGCDDFYVFTHEPRSGGGFFTDKDGIIRDGGNNYADDPRYMKRC